MYRRILIVIVAFLIFTGCYTVIKHPEIANPQNPQHKYQVYFADDCNSCHNIATEHLSYSTSPNVPRLNYILNNPRWNYFYEAPWWYRDIFYRLPMEQNTDFQNDLLPTTSARRRFPGANSGNSGGNITSRINAGHSSSSTRISSSSKNTINDGTSNQTVVRQKSNSNKTRKAIRGSGKSSNKSNQSSSIKKRQSK